MKIPHYLIGSVSAYSGVLLEDESVSIPPDIYEDAIRKGFKSFARLCDATSYTIIGAVFHNMAANWTVTVKE